MNLLPARNDRLASLLLRIGLAAVFWYAAYSSLRQPLAWIGYLPGFITTLVHPELALRMFAIYEIVIGLWLISGKYVRYAAVLCAMTLGGIVALNFNQLIVTFRDVGLLFAALALVFIKD